MNNYHIIQYSWDIADQSRYPHLFEWTVERMKEGMDKGEKVKR